MLGAVTWTTLPFLPAFLVPAKSVGQLDPRKLAARVNVISRRQRIWVIKAARRHVDLVQVVFVLEGQLGAAPGTKTPPGLRGRTKPGGLAGHQPELRPSHAEPRDERSAGSSTTDRAVTVCLIKGRTRRLIAELPAKASTLKHCNSLLSVLGLNGLEHDLFALVRQFVHHEGKQRLNANSHLGFPRSRPQRVRNAHNKFLSPARNPNHVSASALTRKLGWSCSPESIEFFPGV